MNHVMMQTGINTATPSSASKRKPEKSAKVWATSPIDPSVRAMDFSIVAPSEKTHQFTRPRAPIRDTLSSTLNGGLKIV